MGRSAGGGTLVLDDLRRSLTQFFGDGQGYILEGAYIDLFQIHSLTRYFFQRPSSGVLAPERFTVQEAEPKTTRLAWSTAYAGGHPIDRYEIYRREINDRLGTVPAAAQRGAVHLRGSPARSGKLAGWEVLQGTGSGCGRQRGGHGHGKGVRTHQRGAGSQPNATYFSHCRTVCTVWGRPTKKYVALGSQPAGSRLVSTPACGEGPSAETSLGAADKSVCATSS